MSILEHRWRQIREEAAKSPGGRLALAVEEVDRLRAWVDRLAVLLQEADDELSKLSEGEECDHAVGGLFRLRELIRDAVLKAKEGVR